MLNSLNGTSSLPDHKLTLKKGYIVMLLRNLEPAKGHVNGSRYIVEKMSNSLLHLKSACGEFKGERLLLPRVPFSPGDNQFPVPGFLRLKFPVQICFAITTNKAEGQSFNSSLGLDLRQDCFIHGQLNVALSRFTHPKKLTILSEKEDRKALNIFYPEVLTTSNSTITT